MTQGTCRRKLKLKAGQLVCETMYVLTGCWFLIVCINNNMSHDHAIENHDMILYSMIELYMKGVVHESQPDSFSGTHVVATADVASRGHEVCMAPISCTSLATPQTKCMDRKGYILHPHICVILVDRVMQFQLVQSSDVGVSAVSDSVLL